MNTKLYYLGVVLSLGLTACTDGFEELNRDPSTPPYVNANNSGKEEEPTPPEVLPGDYSDLALRTNVSEEAVNKLREVESSIGSEFRKLTYEGLVDNYQRTTNLTHDIYAGYFAHNNPAFNFKSPCYTYTPGWSDLRWEQFYQKRTAEYQTIAKVCHYVDKEKYHNAFYVARIYYAFLISTMTDTYGDMPISPMIACEPTPEHATYQPQSEVYDKIFRMLREAVEQIDPNRGGFMFDPADDKCYSGDLSRWVRFANSLRLRLALRIANVAPERARAEGEAALSHPGGLMHEQADRLRTIPAYAPVAMGGVDDSGRENEVVNCSVRYLDAVMSKDLELAYKNLSSVRDPRLEISWYRPSPMDDLEKGKEWEDQDFAGCEIGNHNVKRISDNYSVLRVDLTGDPKTLSDTHWFSYVQEYIWFGYAECKFLQAEAALRGWSGAGGTAKDLYLEGIRESLRYYHITEDKIAAYIAGLHDKSFEGSNREAQLEAIITQKWMAIFPNGNEAWAEVRRTDYPRLRYPLVTLDPDIPVGKFIKRVSYPLSEYVSNGENVPLINQGNRLWWDVADTNIREGQRADTNNFR